MLIQYHQRPVSSMDSKNGFFFNSSGFQKNILFFFFRNLCLFLNALKIFLCLKKGNKNFCAPKKVKKEKQSDER